MSEITLIAAIGERGQLGLKGDMPWGRGFPDDLKRFREVTAGGVVIVGHRTWPSVQHLNGTHGRLFLVDDPLRTPHKFADDIAITFGNPEIFIAGGAKTFARWMPRITAFDVTRLPFEGPADVYADFLLPHVTRELAA